MWMLETWLGPEWKPEKAKLVLTVDPVTRFLLVQVDPGSPGAWRRDPYYGQLKNWAAAGIAQGRQVIVFLNKSATVVLPDRDVPLGIMGPNDRIVARERRTPQGITLDVEKVAA